MTAPRTIDELHAAIDRLVAEYMGEVRRRVAQRMLDEPRTVDEQFAAYPRPERQSPVTTASKGNNVPAARRKSVRRRSSAEIRQDGLRLVDLVREDPGMGMRHYAAKLGMSSDQMARPSVVVQRENLIRSVGEKGATRYFPVYT